MLLNKTLKDTYFSILNGRIFTENGEIIPIFDSYAPDSVKEPYVLLTVPSVVQIESSFCDMYTAGVQVDVVTKSVRPTGMNQAEGIASQIDALIRPSRAEDIPGVGDTTLMSVRPIISKSGQKYVYRQILTYNHLV